MNKASELTTGFERLLEKLPAVDQFITIDLPLQESWPATPHRLGEQEALAIVAAVGAGRPLLVEGEPGVGKSHLARAAAELLDWHFISTVVQPDTEYRELLWQMDHTERLGRAQLLAHQSTSDAKTELAAENFISAGPLWWAFDYAGKKPLGSNGYQPEDSFNSTADSSKKRSENGVVLLLDEIDKADISLCNGLLEALGNNGFRVPAIGKNVCATLPRPPLVIITSNQTRHLPPAFLRRCIRLTLPWPEDQLEAIGMLHFKSIDSALITQAANLIRQDRSANPEPPRSGLAEYLDLLRALAEIPVNKDTRHSWLERLGPRFLKGDQR